MQLTRILPPELPVRILQRFAGMIAIPILLALVILSVFAWQGGKLAALWLPIAGAAITLALMSATFVVLRRAVRWMDWVVDLAIEWVRQLIQRIKTGMSNFIEAVDHWRRFAQQFATAVSKLARAVMHVLGLKD
jgi:hypothetical protein